ncbi:hypothetical protein EH204_17890 [Pectobacterium carotovorum subsp. carotovorum]|nr:hypothetical protein EH204_17890 [Pectobacterium carotovorum subsp. carotovorum]
MKRVLYWLICHWIRGHCICHTSEITQYTRHTSSCMCVGFASSPESLTQVSSSDSFACRLPETRII